MKEITGGCYCRATRYRIDGEPKQACICYCDDCRKICGAQSVAWITAPLNRFAFTQGEPVHFRSSPPVIRTFCRYCGTALTYQHEKRPDQIDITIGSLDDPTSFPPSESSFKEHKLSWDCIPNSIKDSK